MVSIRQETQAEIVDIINQAIESKTLPNVVFGVTSAEKELIFAHAGTRVLSEPSSGYVDKDTIFWMCSMTKMVASLALLQLVDRGKVSLDDAASQYLPELANLRVQYRTTDNTIATKPAEKQILVRHLLNHSSGLYYSEIGDMDANLVKPYTCIYNKQDDIKVFAELMKPLRFEPGTDFAYGFSTDFAGFVVERVSGQSLEEYLKENIFDPLGITSASFFLTPERKSRLIELCYRNQDGSLTRWDDQLRITPQDPELVNICFAGVGMYCSMKDYLTILRHLLQLKAGTAEKPLFKPETVDLIFQPSLTEKGGASLSSAMENIFTASQHSLALALNMTDWNGMRKSITGWWAGWAGTFFYIDTKTGIASVIGTQVVPALDGKIIELSTRLEQLVYSGLGNTAFKIGDYPGAVGHYTEAILADRNDPTFPLNRAAAYLKLGKNEDAERDCTTVLRLNSSSVKAFFRRSQARVALRKLSEARQANLHVLSNLDLTDALKFEPTNTSARNELEKLEQLISAEQAKRSKTASLPTSVSLYSASRSINESSPKRRRVPITIVEPAALHVFENPSPKTTLPPPTKADSRSDTLTPISSGPLKGPIPAKPSASATPSASSLSEMPQTSQVASMTSNRSAEANSFQEAKRARDGTKTARVGGGIFRSSGDNTVFPMRESAASPLYSKIESPSTNAGFKSRDLAYPVNVSITNGSTRSPITMFSFTKAWESNRSTEERWKLITSISPTNIPSMCGSSLEPAQFISIMDVFLQVLEGNGKDEMTKTVIREYLRSFGSVPRFTTLLLFLSEKEKGLVQQLWNALEVVTLQGAWVSLGK
ncbi:hypothetical protein AMATHDRAFT_45559 [Amanita thiersii Skay4041]|uniref:Uncharacterized protein n=1 Tax=Amanita thiersii Skay4041 TaxID=703135 RepID=A0A2A9NXT7_9AGAR|nr:hypothetical protein AMATHDRAFT_45559 [Amanita thiersii Skay4041]